jgi:hypothetical protein
MKAQEWEQRYGYTVLGWVVKAMLRPFYPRN